MSVFNKIILCELIPFLKEKNQTELIDLLEAVEEIPLNIKWDDVIEYQFKNIKNNYRKIGIPDLIILENLLQNNLEIYTFDKHFKLMSNVFDFKIYNKI
ncbi:MAG TPA: PIN domain nuclease [Spirochaetia bacterium]|nr:PIN domain nuclease [Spirochaetia bacterium]